MITSDIQKLEPGNRIRLFEVDGTAFDAGILRFHCDAVTHTPEALAAAGGDASKIPPKSLWWQGHEYSPWPVHIEGIETSSDGQSAEPKLTVANLDGSISALCLHFNDMAQAKVTLRDTFKHYLDAVNFPEGNPTADPTQEFVQTWYIDRKSAETNEIVEFALSNPANLQGLRLPRRQIQAICTWSLNGDYRSGRGCDYVGTRYFDERGNAVDDPSKDSCGGLLKDCKARFGLNAPLPFGGMPGSALIKR